MVNVKKPTYHLRKHDKIKLISAVNISMVKIKSKGAFSRLFKLMALLI